MGNIESLKRVAFIEKRFVCVCEIPGTFQLLSRVANVFNCELL